MKSRERNANLQIQRGLMEKNPLDLKLVDCELMPQVWDCEDSQLEGVEERMGNRGHEDIALLWSERRRGIQNIARYEVNVETSIFKGIWS